MSWQSIAAIIGHENACALIKEYYAIKSSAVLDKNIFIQKMIKDGEYIMKDTYYSPTTTTLNCYLAMIFMRYQGFEPVYIDRTIRMIQHEEIIIDDDTLGLMVEELDHIKEDIIVAPEKYDFEGYIVPEKEVVEIDEDDYEPADDTEIGSEEDVVLRIDDLFEEGCIDDIEEDKIGLEDDLE